MTKIELDDGEPDLAAGLLEAAAGEDAGRRAWETLLGVDGRATPADSASRPRWHGCHNRAGGGGGAAPGAGRERAGASVRVRAVWTRAEALLRDRPASRYLGGVCAACRWVAAYPGAVSPLRREVAAATAELILREDIAATLAADGEAVDGVAVDERWAAGVAMTLGWARAALTGDPLRPAARGVDDDGHERDSGRER